MPRVDSTAKEVPIVREVGWELFHQIYREALTFFYYPFNRILHLSLIVESIFY